MSAFATCFKTFTRHIQRRILTCCPGRTSCAYTVGRECLWGKNRHNRKSSVRRNRFPKEEKSAEKVGTSLSDDENISLSGAKKSLQCHLFYLPQTDMHTQMHKCTKDLIQLFLQTKRRPLGKIRRLQCNQHLHNGASFLFYLFTSATLGHLPSVL